VLVPAGDSSDNGGDNGGGETGDSKAGTWAETAKEVHGLAGNLIIFLALMHVAGVVFESRAMRRNLVKPMLFGQDK
jgi:cytochrome b